MKVISLPKCLTYLCRMEWADDFPEVQYQQWLEKVKLELKGGDFEDLLVHPFEDVQILPVYHQTPAFSQTELGEEDEEWSREEGHGPAWQAALETTFTSGYSVATLLENTLNEGVEVLRITGDIQAFLQALAKEHPLPVTICLSNPELPNSEEDEKQWRELLGRCKVHHAVIWSLEFDPLSTWIQTGNCADPTKTFDHLFYLTQKLTPDLTDCRFFCVDARVAAESGANLSTQLAYTMCAANQYMAECLQRGAEVFEIAHQFVFRFSQGTAFFPEIAKLKAFRILWRNFLETWDPEYDYFEHPPIHSSTSNVTNARAEQHNNILRSTTSAMSSILGGSEVLTIHPYTSASDEHAKRMALNIHRILRFESNMDAYSHAANGCYFLDQLTVELASKAWDIFLEWETAGGFISCMQKGIIQEKIASDRAAKMKEYVDGKNLLIGVNAFITETPKIEMSPSPIEGTFPALKLWNIEQALNDEQAT